MTIPPPEPPSPELVNALRQYSIEQQTARLYADNAHLDYWPDDNWPLWAHYFRRLYGPLWTVHRLGQRGECDYCSGRIRTEESDKRTPRIALRRRGSCADETV